MKVIMKLSAHHSFTLTFSRWSAQHPFIFSLCLSWVYALTSQIMIPLPFNLVPLSIQPLPVTLCTLLIGRHAITAYILYLIQGSAGAPFFANYSSGIGHLIGPTGGYLVGFLCAALFLNTVRTIKPSSRLITLLKIQVSNIITFTCGLAYLSFFVPTDQLFLAGLAPFIFGDFVLKALLQITLMELALNASAIFKPLDE